MKNVTEIFNALDGKTVSRSRLKKLRTLAIDQSQPEIVRRIDRILLDNPKSFFGLIGPDRFKIKLARKLQGDKNALALGSPGLINKRRTENDDIYGLDFLEYKEGQDAGLGVAQDDIYQYVTDLIINTINREGYFPWQKSWEKSGLSDGKEATNYESKKGYRGINYIMLNFGINFDNKGEPYLTMINYENPYFLTFKQIQKFKGRLKKGSKAKRVFYFTKLYGHSEKQGDGTKLEFYSYDKKKFLAWIKKNSAKLRILKRKGWSVERLADSYIPILKYYNVYNAGDIKGIKWDAIPKNGNAEQPESKKIQVAEAIVANYPNPPKIVFRGDQPHYQIQTDTVVQTPLSQFSDPQSYYSVLFHELIHSTGAKKRLNRPFGTKSSPLYAKEELVAEMGAVFLCAESGILFKTLNNSAAYLKSWNRRLVSNMKKDNRFFFRAASKAQEAADYILSRDKSGKPKYQKSLVSSNNKKSVASGKGKSQLRPRAGTRKKSVDRSTAKKQVRPGRTRKKTATEGRQLGLFGTMSVPNKPSIKETLNYAEKNLFGKSIFHRDIGKKILFTKSGIKKAISGKRGVSKIRLQLVFAAKRLLESSRLIKIEKDKKSRKNILNIYKLNSFHEINGVKYKIFIVIRESSNRILYYDHDAIQIKKHSAQTGDKSTPLGSPRVPSVVKNTKSVPKSGKRPAKGKTRGLGEPLILDGGTPYQNTQVAQIRDIPVQAEPIEISPDPTPLKRPLLASNPKKPVIKTRQRQFGRKMSEVGKQTNEVFQIKGALAHILGGIEKKPKGSVVVTLDAEQGSGKTRTFFQAINAFAEAGNEVTFLSLEEHPDSNLFTEKRDQYLSEYSKQNVLVLSDEEVNSDNIDSIFENSDIVFTDSFGKLYRLLGKIDLDDDIRKKYDGKLFFFIYQRTKDGKMRGGSASAFDADIVSKMEKDHLGRNHKLYFNKNRYEQVPGLKYNINTQEVEYPEFEILARQANDSQILSF